MKTGPYYGQVFPVVSPIGEAGTRDLGPGLPSPVSAYNFTWIDGTAQIEEEEMNRRYVHVLIVDPDERIPVESALLYAGTTYLTDMTDEEVFLSLDLGTLLEKHNVVRETILDEEETRKRGKDVYLPPIRIRDLAKRVVVVATF